MEVQLAGMPDSFENVAEFGDRFGLLFLFIKVYINKFAACASLSNLI